MQSSATAVPLPCLAFAFLKTHLFLHTLLPPFPSQQPSRLSFPRCNLPPPITAAFPPPLSLLHPSRLQSLHPSPLQSLQLSRLPSPCCILLALPHPLAATFPPSALIGCTPPEAVCSLVPHTTCAPNWAVYPQCNRWALWDWDLCRCCSEETLPKTLREKENLANVVMFISVRAPFTFKSC